jgi:hypothetical protein
MKLANEVLKDPRTANARLILADVTLPKAPANAKDVVCVQTDLTKPEEAAKLFKTAYGLPQVVYCMHGIMSRGSEDNFDFGIKVGSRYVTHCHSLLTADLSIGERRFYSVHA